MAKQEKGLNKEEERLYEEDSEKKLKEKEEEEDGEEEVHESEKGIHDSTLQANLDHDNRLKKTEETDSSLFLKVEEKEE